MSLTTDAEQISGRDERAATLVRALAGRSIVLVGMMGAGKTSVGKRLAQRLGLSFVDADTEIETAARMTIPEIFARHGEPFFRDREQVVIGRLLAEGQKVLATGGGAFMAAATRERIRAHAVSVWLRADVDVLLRRVRRRSNRPMLATEDPEDSLRRLVDLRYPVYSQADMTVESRDGPHEAMVETVLQQLERGLGIVRYSAPGAGLTQRLPGGGEGAVVPVELDARSYEILIGPGLIEDAGRHIRRVAPKAACFIVTDENVGRTHLPSLLASLDALEIRHSQHVIAPGEASKCYATFEAVCDAVIKARMERGDLIIALGGGVVGDLAGFVAATVRRGMRFIQIPTSLLAQVDSSVGGKTAINSPYGKNLVGAFHQPVLVLADTGALASLPSREFRAGYAEVAKYGVINDAQFFYWLERNHPGVFALGPELIEAIRKSCAAKADVVARDETEQGDRMLLNLGHTFGHAFEHLVHFDGARLIHGEAVAIGMACAMRFSVKLGHASGQEAERVAAHLRQVGLGTQIGDIPGLSPSVDLILDAMFQDKKVQGGALTFILARGIGQSFIARGVPVADVREFLAGELTGH